MRKIAVLSACLCLYTAIAWGQATTSLRGTVSDPSGLSIHQARVTILNADTGFSRTVVTGPDGSYIFAEVLPGTYKMVVEAQGFNRYEQSGLMLQVELPATLDVRLKVGAANETVSVNAEAPLLNTTDASVGHSMDSLAIEDLPLPFENNVLLLSLQPGVAFNGENLLQDSYDTRAGMVNGERSDQNNITLDGVSNNDEFAGYAFNGVLPTTPFSVDEFRVSTSNYGVSEGRSSGAQIAMVTKSGTNQFHGSLYEFNRNGVGEANDFFLKNSQLSANQSNRPAQLVWNDYGGTIGGPIWKNRLFFFFNYEGHRFNQGESVEQSVPGPLLQDGIIQYACDQNVADAGANPSACSNGMTVTGASGKTYTIAPGNYALGPTQLAQMDPLGIGPSQGVLKYFQGYPKANDLNFGDAPNFAGYRFATPTTNRDNWFIGRVDFKLSQNHTLFFRGTGIDDRDVPTGGGPFLPGLPPQYTTVDLAKGFVIGYTSLWGSHLVNNLRYGLTRDSFGLNGDSNQPWVQFRDLNQNINYSSGNTAPVHNIADSFDWIKGSHDFQFGINFLLSRLNSYDYNGVFSDALTNADFISAGGFANDNDFLNPACNAQYTPSTTQGSSCTAADIYPAVDPGFAHAYDFPLAALMGIESEVDGEFNYSVGAKQATQLAQNLPIVRHWSTDNYNFFFQDTWKARRNLTISYGLNYQLMTPMTETSGQEVTPNVNIGTWFNQRQADMYKGIPNNQVLGGSGLIGFGPAGSVYGKPGLYSTQSKNFAPRLGIAWTPRSDSGWTSKLFGDGKTSVRAGAGMYYQNFGPELAQFYSASGEFGLSSLVTNAAHQLSLNAAPRVGSSLADMNIIPLSLLGSATPPQSFTFPATPAAGLPNGLAIASGIDQSLKTPYSYAVDLSIQRELPGKMTLDVAYVGHFAHRLMVLDDVAAPMNLVDPKSGISYFAAASRLSAMGRQNVPESNINASSIGKTAQYWQDMLQPQSSYTLCSTGASTTNMLQAVYDVFTTCGDLYNETSALFDIDAAGFPATPTNGLFSYYNSQYSSLWDWRSIAWSNYNALQVSLNKQMSNGVMFGFNYTYSKSLDIESGAERSIHYLTDSVINPWDPAQMYGPSDSDLRHQINGYWVLELPFGRGKSLAGTAHGVTDALISGWRLGGTTRWTSGFPTSVFEGYVWPTNWDEMGWASSTGAPMSTGTTITDGQPNVFKDAAQWQTSGCVCGSRAAFGYAYPGQSGTRNPVRGDGYLATDMNLSKQWKVTERQNFELRWSVFNVFNNTRFDPYHMQDEWDVPSSFGNYTSTLTNPRRMEFAGIYRF